MPKGVCEIILEENGKEVLHTRDENMVTNAIANLLNPPANMFYKYGDDGGYLNYGNVISSKTPIATKLLGGVLLFQNQIAENVNTIFPPSDNPQIGYAGNDAYSGTNTMRGSYSTTESQKLDNGYKHVWNFSEPQANGTIRCVSLTSPQGGKSGWNAVADVLNNFLVNLSPDLTATEDTQRKINDISGIIGNYAKDVFTAIKSVSDKTVTFTDYVSPMSANLNNNLLSPSSTDVSKTSNLTLNSFIEHWFSSDDFCSSIYNSSASNTFQYVKFKGSDKSILLEQTITVTDGNFDFSRGFTCNGFGEKDGYLYVQDYTTQSKIWKINLSNTADITYLTLPESVAKMKISQVSNFLIFENLLGRNAYLYNGTSFFLVGTFLPNSGTAYYSPRIIPSKFIPTPYVLCTSDNMSNLSSYFCLSIITPYLATIDNLASPVTKTANQTMKVIYTITNS